MQGIRYSKDSIPTYYDSRLHDACDTYGSVFESFTLTEKFNILTAIGMWGEYCDQQQTQMPLGGYMRQFCPVRDDTDAYDMLCELSNIYPQARDAMGLVLAVASQISEGIWLASNAEAQQ